ncbi:MAG: HAMP domain-containing protein, partial [Candidatus Aureabacteria bacterium]|nr:HAMP domain-containing protein [Candidatus Auribacterota bacterium]
MKRLRIGATLTLGIAFCIALSIIIGIVALINIGEMKENIEEIKICKDIEIEVLECRRQEKNILLLGPYKKERLEKKEENTYLEKLNDNLRTLRKLVEEGERKFAASEKEFNGIILAELDNYELFLKNVETNYKEREELIQKLETIIEEFQSFFRNQSSALSSRILQFVSESHAQMHHYIFYRNGEFVDSVENEIKALKEMAEDEKVITMADEYLAMFGRLVENTGVIENYILRMRKSGRKTQQAVLKIIKIVEGKIESAERAMIGVVWAAVILAVSFGGGISLFLSRSITKPIHKLSAATVTISKGDLSCRVAVESSDEIGELAQSFNKMTEDLQKTTVSKDYVDNIIENMLDTLIAVDVDGRIKEVNKAMCKLLGYEQKALIGKPSRRLFGKKTPFEGA